MSSRATSTTVITVLPGRVRAELAAVALPATDRATGLTSWVPFCNLGRQVLG